MLGLEGGKQGGVWGAFTDIGERGGDPEKDRDAGVEGR